MSVRSGERQRTCALVYPSVIRWRASHRLVEISTRARSSITDFPLARLQFGTKARVLFSFCLTVRCLVCLTHLLRLGYYSKQRRCRRRRHRRGIHVFLICFLPLQALIMVVEGTVHSSCRHCRPVCACMRDAKRSSRRYPSLNH